MTTTAVVVFPVMMTIPVMLGASGWPNDANGRASPAAQCKGPNEEGVEWELERGGGIYPATDIKPLSGNKTKQNRIHLRGRCVFVSEWTHRLIEISEGSFLNGVDQTTQQIWVLPPPKSISYVRLQTVFFCTQIFLCCFSEKKTTRRTKVFSPTNDNWYTQNHLCEYKGGMATYSGQGPALPCPN